MHRVSLAILLLLATVHLQAASFDCTKARTAVEKAICSSPRLSASDDKLAQAYRAAQANVPEAAELIRQSERDWLLEVERNCRRQETDLSFSDCLAQFWQDRTDFLSRIVVRMGGVLFIFREISLGKPCDEEDLSTGLAKSGPQGLARLFAASCILHYVSYV